LPRKSRKNPEEIPVALLSKGQAREPNIERYSSVKFEAGR